MSSSPIPNASPTDSASSPVKTMITSAIASSSRNTAVSATRRGQARHTGRRSTPQISAEALKKQPMYAEAVHRTATRPTPRRVPDWVSFVTSDSSELLAAASEFEGPTSSTIWITSLTVPWSPSSPMRENSTSVPGISDSTE